MISTAPPNSAAALTFTGERFAPEVRGAIWHEHWHRYALALPICRGKRVLDAASGEGYGSFLIASSAREVVGVDISTEAIAHARERYAAPNLRYREGSCTALPVDDASVDVVVSFETIEHLAEQAEMLAEFRRVLAPDGALVISSPNKPVYSGEAPVENHYHVKELTRDELAALLARGFPQQRWYAQRVLAHSVLWSEGAEPAARHASLVALESGQVTDPAHPAPPMYYVVVCGAAGVTLPALPSLSLFDDGAQSLLRDYSRALAREKALYWDELDARKIAEDRLAEVIAAVNALASERQKTKALRVRVAALEIEQTSLKAALERQAGELADVRARLAYRESAAGWLRWPGNRLRAKLARGK